MPQQDVITQLIFEDLKYHQFMAGLQQLDLTLEYHPNFPVLVARLMGIPRGQVDDEWMETYSAYMEQGKACGYHEIKELMDVADRLRRRLGEFG